MRGNNLAARYYPVIRARYQRLGTAGKPAQIALVAASRKLLMLG